MGKRCERCDGVDTFQDEQGRVRVSEFVDFCNACGRDLCVKCMALGCCGNVPAKSGNAALEVEDEAVVRKRWEAARRKHPAADAGAREPGV